MSAQTVRLEWRVGAGEVKLLIPCDHCGEVAEQEMPIREARDHAAALLAACGGLPLLRAWASEQLGPVGHG